MRGFLFLALVGCASDRAVVEIPVAFQASEEAVELPGGVRVTLRRAEATLADLRLQAPEGTARVRRPWSLVPSAYAHPGHDAAGEVGGELLGAWTLDLIGDDVALGSARCFEGPYATGQLDLRGAPGVLLEGTASVGGAEVPFRFALSAEERIAGIPFDVVLDGHAPPERIVLSVDLAHALSFVDWATPDVDGDGVLTTADGALANTVVFGVLSTPTWNLTLEE